MIEINNDDYTKLSRLVTEISWRIDHGQAETVWELFTPDGSMNTSGTPIVGHDALREWGKTRDKSDTKSRHLCTGMRFTAVEADKATGSTILTVFMGKKGLIGSSIPAVVGEDHDEFVRTPDGWRFVSRTFETHFVAAQA
jgi:hypothetical protein